MDAIIWPTRYGFLDLPAELRLEIYRHLFLGTYVTARFCDMCFYYSNRRLQPHADLTILQTCQQIRAEAEEVFYRYCTFDLRFMTYSCHEYPMQSQNGIGKVIRGLGCIPVDRLHKMQRCMGSFSMLHRLNYCFDEDMYHTHGLNVLPTFEPSLIKLTEMTVEIIVAEDESEEDGMRYQQREYGPNNCGLLRSLRSFQKNAKFAVHLQLALKAGHYRGEEYGRKAAPKLCIHPDDKTSDINIPLNGNYTRLKNRILRQIKDVPT